MYNNNCEAPRTNHAAYFAVVKCGHGKTKEYEREKNNNTEPKKKTAIHGFGSADVLIIMIFKRN